MKNKLFGPSINQAHDLLFSKKFSKMEYCIFHWVTQDISENKILSKFLWKCFFYYKSLHISVILTLLIYNLSTTT